MPPSSGSSATRALCASGTCASCAWPEVSATTYTTSPRATSSSALFGGGPTVSLLPGLRAQDLPSQSIWEKPRPLAYTRTLIGALEKQTNQNKTTKQTNPGHPVPVDLGETAPLGVHAYALR